MLDLMEESGCERNIVQDVIAWFAGVQAFGLCKICSNAFSLSSSWRVRGIGKDCRTMLMTFRCGPDNNC